MNPFWRGDPGTDAGFAAPKPGLAGVVLGLAVMVAACSTDPPLPAPTTVPIAPTTSASLPVTQPPATDPAPSPTTTAASTTTTTLAPLQGLAYEVVTTEASQPVGLIGVPGVDHLFVVERPGRIRKLHADGTLEPYLDLTGRVAQSGIEQGLLGVAFHPDFVDNGRLFVYYVAAEDDNGRLVELTATPEQAGADTEQVLLRLDQAIIRHYGGMLVFGPDGKLWLSLGEGGAASVHAQDPSTLLGSILRLDVDAARPYAAPADNPFVDGGGSPEVWAFGLRNPWRFAIDPVDRLIYIADVGQESWEEINVVSLADGGHNFGWLRMEGFECFQRGCDPDQENLTLPAYAYSHDEGCSITGGLVYRGSAIPELDGHYFFSDWCQGWLRSYHHSSGEVTDWSEDVGEIGQVNGFGQDLDGELYVLTWEETVARIVPER